MQNKISLILGCLLMVFTSCDSNQVFDEYKSVSNPWNKNEIVDFVFQAPDTLNNYNLFVNLRNNNDYEFSNLFLIVEMNYPNGKVEKDTLEYEMAKPDGTFLGSGFSDIKENKLWYKGYKIPYFFSESGEYKVYIQQAMRENGQVKGVESLYGVLDVGFRIEKSQSN